MSQDVLDSLRAMRQPLGHPRRWPAKLDGNKGYDYRFRRLVRRRDRKASHFTVLVCLAGALIWYRRAVRLTC